MKRVLILCVSFTAVLGLAAGWGWRLAGERAVAAGELHHANLPEVEKKLARPRDERPALVWVGDSTIVSTPVVSYPVLLGRDMRRTVDHRVITSYGLGPELQYAIVGSLTRFRPDVLVLIVNLRRYVDDGRAANHLSFFRHLPWRELPRASLLPLEHWGLRVGDILSYRWLALPSLERLYHAGEGSRLLFRSEVIDEILGGTRPPRRLDPTVEVLAAGLDVDRPELIEFAMRSFDIDLRPSHPGVRMLGAAVSLGVRNGARVLAVLTPIPHPWMDRVDFYDRDEFTAGLAPLRAAVEQAGGDFLDLSHALEREDFRDLVGHLGPSGMRAMQQLVGPEVARLLAESDTQRAGARGRRRGGP